MGQIQPSSAYFKPQMRLFFFYGDWAGTQANPQGPINLPFPLQELKANVASKPSPSEAITGLGIPLRPAFPMQDSDKSAGQTFTECLF